MKIYLELELEWGGGGRGNHLKLLIANLYVLV